MAVTLKGQSAIYEGTSADMKPSDADKNAIFQELDTGIDYYYDGTNWNEIPSSGGGGGGTGTDNYNELSNKPSINSVTLSGNKTAANLGLQAEITGDVTISSDNVDDTGATNLFVTSSEKSTWNGKQDALIIDSEPTESSTNPVQSGGVYTALSGKQAALAFDGTYSATTNKVATESTVTGAISALDKSSVGLDNVTNNAQVKAVSGAVTSGDIVTFGADGATVQDSGKAIETSLTDSNDKVPTSKAVRDNVAANATMSSGYAADSSEASITSSTSINDAIEQLDYRTTSNKNNILSLTANGGGKNKLKITAASSAEMTINDDKSVSITVNASTQKQYNLTGWIPNNYVGMKISGMTVNSNVSTGYFISVQYSNNGTSWANETDIATIGSATILDYPYINVGIVVRGGNDLDNVLFKPMISDNGEPYQPYALSNAELTAEVKPLAYSNPTPQSTDITLQSGGYYKIGNSVTVCIRATVSNALAAWAPIFSGFPVPITDNSIAENSAVVAVSSNAGVGIGVTKRGIMQGFDAIPAGTLLLNCTYLCV